MAGRLGRSKAVVVVVALALAACSGDDDEDASADASSRTTTTLAPEPTITTTVAAPPLYSFDGSVPAPALNITGDDFDAIFRSLNAYLSWLYAHNPDAELVGEVAAFGSAQYDTIARDIDDVAGRGLRIYDDAAVESVAVADTADGVVTLRVRYSGGRRVLIDETANVVDDTSFAPLEQIVLLSASPSAQWRVASISNSDGDSVEVNE